MLSFIVATLAVLVLCIGAWFLFTKLNLPGIIDMFWSLGILLAALIYFIMFKSYHHMSLALGVTWLLLIIWALRLSGYIWYTRIRVKHVDLRYEAIASKWKMNRKSGFLFNYLFQGLLMSLVALPFYFIAQIQETNHFNLWILDLFVFSMLCFEATADWQLINFKKKQLGKVCNIGLWQYSRHPNYFFDWCIWVGFALIALSVDYGILSIISPILLLYIMFGLTIPISEKHYKKSKGADFDDYCENTPKFFPKSPI